jgi:Ca2+-binding RTX toxin-like protein
MATIFGTAGGDLINSTFTTPTTAGNDTIFGLGGDDTIVASGGNDFIDGGSGFDTLDYSTISDRVIINAAVGTMRQLSGTTLVKTDTFTNIELWRTGSGDDSLTGSGADEQFRPGLGRDYVNGAGGFDGVQYTEANARVLIDLVRGFAIDHGGFRDTLISIEFARGGAANDVIRVGVGAGLQRGGPGNDTIVSTWNGVVADTGGIGVDYFERGSGSPVTVDLAAGFAQIGTERDTLIGNFTHVRGGAGADTLLGNQFDNGLRPGNGADKIDGRGGFDRVDYRDEGGAITASMTTPNSGTVLGADGTTDTLTSIEWVRGSNFNDTLQAVGAAFVMFGAYGFALSDETTQLEGWIGNDQLIGQAGRAVIARYAADPSPIFVDMAAGFAIDGWGGIDTLTNIWGIRGSAFDDVITLGAGNEFVRADAGNDVLDGGAGLDRVSYASAPAAVIVDLAAGTAQDGWGTIDSITGFEVVTGSGFDDQLFGDATDNWFLPDLGDDLVDGREGSDTVVYFYAANAIFVDLAAGAASGQGVDSLVSIENAIGSAFDDLLRGTAGNNQLYGHLGNDILDGGPGNDLLDGGDGFDTADYSAAPSRVVVNLSLAGPQNTLGAGLDTLVSIENLLGSAFNDTLTGNGQANYLSGLAGNDALYGGDGDDTIDGGAGDDIMQGQGGYDTADYGTASAAVTVSLALQGAFQNTIGAGSDYLNGIENLAGSEFADTLTGNAAANVIEGGDGDDTIDGGAGNDTIDGGDGNDTLIGGAGTDTASYASAPSGVSVSLLLQGGAQNTVAAGIDTLSGFENLTGSPSDDELTGDAAANTLRGGDGDDILEGGLGNDLLYGGDGIDLASYAGAAGPVTVTLNAFSGTVAAGTDYFYDIEGFLGSAFNDTLTGNALDNVLRGADGDDRLYGLDGNDTFVGGPGNDQYYGGSGIDTVDFSEAALNVRAILGSAGFVNTSNYGSDLYNSIENLIGGSGNDSLTGDGNANLLDGRAGNDTLFGGAGDDRLLGGAGNDLLIGDAGADAIDLGTGFDIVWYRAAADSRAATMDRITNFTQNGGDGFDRLWFDDGANALFAGVAPSSIALGTRVSIEAASTLDDVIAQITGLAASTASALSVTQVDVGFGGAAGRYVVVNDTIAAFDPAADMLIAIGMAPGSATNLTAANFFLL